MKFTFDPSCNMAYITLSDMRPDQKIYTVTLHEMGANVDFYLDTNEPHGRVLLEQH